MKNWNYYKQKTYTQNEARKMDYELDIIHNLIAELYNNDANADSIKGTLDKINKVVHTK